MRRLAWALLLVPLLAAHMISMSTGDVTVSGPRLHYQLRMPLYEMSHISDPGSSIFKHIHFRSGGREGRLVEKTCREDARGDAYECAADYEFPAPVERLEVECTFASITVPNHVHLLRAVRDGHRDQGLFDLSFSKATLRFDPPTRAETAFTQLGAGLGRAFGGWVQVLFLASLVLAARSRRELLALGGMFLAGQIASAAVVPLTGWQPAPRFVEAAAALTVAYLAVEILLLPSAGARWLVAGVLGGFHGLYFALFLGATGYGPGYVLAGAAAGEVLLIAVLAVVLRRIGRLAAALRPVQVSAGALFAVGMFWFIRRVWG